ncbi:MAG: hypothetical protein HYR66_14480 [Sphingobacteriales bacterium]|nr:hypothetical protein [Sphingobacteriales bacterium]MBI3720209.1 hypothetical protein [Sphingobacteriales bacterium]
MNENDWQVIMSTGLEHDNTLFENLTFFNKSKAIMLGSRYSEESIINKKLADFEALLWLTDDGGKSWREANYGKGKFSCYDTRDSVLFLAEVINRQEKNETKTALSKILFSSNYGNTINEQGYLNDFFIRNLFILTNNELILIGKKDEEAFWTLKKSENKGITWKDVDTLPNDLSNPVLFGKNIFFLSQKKRNYLMKYSLTDNSLSEYTLPIKEMKIYTINSSEDKLYINCLSENGIKIYHYNVETNSFGLIQGINEKDKFPLHLHANGDNLSLIVGQRTTLGVEYFIYQYQVQGSLKKIQVPSSYFKPFAFNGNEVWGYSYNSKFYKMILW